MHSTTETTAPLLAPASQSSSGRHVDPDLVRRHMTSRSYAVLASVSASGRPHAAGVLYVVVHDTLYVSTDADSRKARNVAVAPHVGVTIPVRRIPFGAPPSAIQFQAGARLLSPTDPEVVRLAESGALKQIVGHGELERDQACVLAIRPTGTIHTYGLGMSLWALARDPLNAAGYTTW